jgi:diguanylate cyclase (GGDEF)-like protein
MSNDPFPLIEVARAELLRSADLARVMPLLQQCSLKTLKKGDVLIEAGTPNGYLYIVLNGFFSVRLDNLHSDPILHIYPGESVGEMSVIDGRPRSAFVVAERRSRVLAIGEALMWTLVKTSNAIASNLLQVLSHRLRHGNAVILKDREQLEKYRLHATMDLLTGLYNRNWLSQTLPRLTERSRESGRRMSLILLDVDNFKQFNDEHGHGVGDNALRAVAASLRDGLRPADMAARYGGDEFIVLLPNTGCGDAALIAERLRCAVEGVELKKRDGRDLLGLTISLGVAEVGHGEEPDDLIGRADAALYIAKRAGRNRVQSCASKSEARLY